MAYSKAIVFSFIFSFACMNIFAERVLKIQLVNERLVIDTIDTEVPLGNGNYSSALTSYSDETVRELAQSKINFTLSPIVFSSEFSKRLEATDIENLRQAIEADLINYLTGKTLNDCKELFENCSDDISLTPTTAIKLLDEILINHGGHIVKSHSSIVKNHLLRFYRIAIWRACLSICDEEDGVTSDHYLKKCRKWPMQLSNTLPSEKKQ